MPQLGSGGGGDDLGATDEMLAFKDEGEQEEKIPENAFTERDLADLKSSLVNESEGSGSPAAAAADPEALRRVQDPQRVYQEKLPDHMDDVRPRLVLDPPVPQTITLTPLGVRNASLVTTASSGKATPDSTEASQCPHCGSPHSWGTLALPNTFSEEYGTKRLSQHVTSLGTP
ncbi:hypothetical protein Nmel_014104 [Mimus melanotis]